MHPFSLRSSVHAGIVLTFILLCSDPAYRPDLSEDSLRENTSKFEGRVFNSVNTRLEYTHKIATGMAVVERQVSQTNPDIVSQAIAAAAAVNSAAIAARPSAPAAAATASAVVNVAVNPAVGPVAAVAQVPANIPPHGVRVGAPAPASQPATSQAHEPLNPLAPERATQYQPHLGRARAQQGFARAQVLETLSQGTIQQHQVQHAPQSQHTSVQTYVPNIRAQDVRQQQMAQHLAQQQALSHSQAATIQAHASRPAHTARRPPPPPQVALQNNARSQLSQGNRQLPLGQSMQQGQLNYHGQIANPHLQGLQQQLLAQYSPQPTSVADQQSQGIRHQQLAQSLQQLRNAPTRIHDPMPAQQPDFDELERRLEQQHVQEQNNLLEKQYVEMHNLRVRRAATAARGNVSTNIEVTESIAYLTLFLFCSCSHLLVLRQ